MWLEGSWARGPRGLHDHGRHGGGDAETAGSRLLARLAAAPRCRPWRAPPRAGLHRQFAQPWPFTRACGPPSSGKSSHAHAHSHCLTPASRPTWRHSISESHSPCALHSSCLQWAYTPFHKQSDRADWRANGRTHDRRICLASSLTRHGLYSYVDYQLDYAQCKLQCTHVPSICHVFPVDFSGLPPRIHTSTRVLETLQRRLARLGRTDQTQRCVMPTLRSSEVIPFWDGAKNADSDSRHDQGA